MRVIFQRMRKMSCFIHNCPSNENTKINGKNVKLFPFPSNDTVREKWLEKIQLFLGADNVNCTQDSRPLKLCELHFGKDQFLKGNELKFDAFPTIFKTDTNHKRRFQDVVIDLPMKRKKMENLSQNIETPPQSPRLKFENNVSVGTRKDGNNSLLKNLDIYSSLQMDKEEALFYKQLENKVYRLTIQIDKVRPKPAPKSYKNAWIAAARASSLRQWKRSQMLAEEEEEEEVPRGSEHREQEETRNRKRKEQLEMERDQEEDREREREQEQGSESVTCARNGCKLQKTVYNSKPAFRCEICGKHYYILKMNDDHKSNTCTLCKKVFVSQESLEAHVMKHFVCELCGTECPSQSVLDEHVKLHESSDSAFPFKCHFCEVTFRVKEQLQQHVGEMDGMCMTKKGGVRKNENSRKRENENSVASRANVPQCKSCRITFRNEQALWTHLKSHTKKEVLRCETPGTLSTSLAVSPEQLNSTKTLSSTSGTGTPGTPATPRLGTNQIGILAAIKFTCRVCSKEFDNVAEVDIHTRTHLEEADEDLACTICKKLFENESSLKEHMRLHLARAFRCSKCPKAFINRTSLKIHLNTHSNNNINNINN